MEDAHQGEMLFTLCRSRQLVSRELYASLVQVGDVLPSVEVHEGTPGDKVNVKELFAGKKGILFGVPGAFTPTCHKVSLARGEVN